MRKAPPEDQCCMGGTLGDEHRCWQEALPSGLWCADCQRDIDHGTKGTCQCPGCLNDFMAQVFGEPVEGRDFMRLNDGEA